MNRVLPILSALAIALPAWAQDAADGTAEPAATDTATETAAGQDDADGMLSLRGDDGDEVQIPPDATDEPEDRATPEAATNADTGADEDVAGDTAPASATGDEEPVADTAANDAAAGEGGASEADNAEASSGAETDAAEAGIAGNSTPQEEESAESDVALTSSAPFLSSTAYAELRPESRGEAIELIWDVETFTPDGQRIGEAEQRTLIMAPDYVRYERGNSVEIFDFATDRHLELDLDAGTFTNTAFAAEVRRRLDTYLGLSQAGQLDQIPLGPGRSFERFWLEAAMGIRREPADLQTALTDGELTVERGDGPPLLTAQFDVSAVPETPEPAPEETEAAETTETPMSAEDAIAAMATPIDLSAGESVVFDPSQAAVPISLNRAGATIDWPEAAPEQQAQAELFRRWMRHALPLHPDVLAALRGAPAIPARFTFFVVSPDSPDGRREFWTLERSGTVPPGFRLEPELDALAGSPELLGNLLSFAASAAMADAAPDDTAIVEAIAGFREAGDPARAFLVAFHETSRNGRCPPPGQSERRAACAEANSVVASGLGNPAFETVFGAVNDIGGDSSASILEAMTPYLDEEGYAGAAARTIAANELMAWAARDPEGPPAEFDPFALLAEAIAIDPSAGANYRYLGNAFLNSRNPIAAWAVYDAGRAVPGAADNELLADVAILEDRLRVLAPDFFLPR